MNTTFPAELIDLDADLLRFEQALQTFSQRLGLSLRDLEADHIAVRCHQDATAARWKQGLQQIATLFSENIINGRPICLFKLHQPITVAGWQLDIIELPWPGEKRYRHEGWEHVEIVLRGNPTRWAYALWRCCRMMP